MVINNTAYEKYYKAEKLRLIPCECGLSYNRFAKTAHLKGGVHAKCLEITNNCKEKLDTYIRNIIHIAATNSDNLVIMQKILNREFE